MKNSFQCSMKVPFENHDAELGKQPPQKHWALCCTVTAHSSPVWAVSAQRLSYGQHTPLQTECSFIGPLSFHATVSHCSSINNNSTHFLGVTFPITEIQLRIEWQLQ